MTTRSARNLFAALALCTILPSCMYHQHRVGVGPAGIQTVTARQWYWLFGLGRLNEVDTQRFAQDSVSYDVVTKFSFTDLLYSILLGPVTVTSRTVVVER
ncbi:MAG: hypothetical protein KDB80_10450 [Planctomycetes bacterium]|nr:hypothetical protein [Planctomycetota bacterium]